MAGGRGRTLDTINPGHKFCEGMRLEAKDKSGIIGINHDSYGYGLNLPVQRPAGQYIRLNKRILRYDEHAVSISMQPGKAQGTLKLFCQSQRAERHPEREVCSPLLSIRRYHIPTVSSKILKAVLVEGGPPSI